MRYLLFFLALTFLLPTITSAQYHDNDGANAYNVAIELGTYDPIEGDDRWVWTGYGMIVSYRIQTASQGVIIVRYGGDVVGRWERDIPTLEMVEIIWEPCGCWVDLASTAGGL